jgi:hypothetical protein
MFWYGFLVGIFCGFNLGLILIGILASGKHADKLIGQLAHQQGSEQGTGRGCEMNQEELSTIDHKEIETLQI